MTAIAPALTRFDRTVLTTVPPHVGMRAGDVIAQRPRAATPDDVLLTLRGLEHLGYVEQRNGWWRRTETGNRIAGLAPGEDRRG